MPISGNLIGPPEIAGLDAPTNQTEAQSQPLELTVDSAINQTSNLSLTDQPQKGLTENLSATYLSTCNPCLDFFFHIVPDTPYDQLIQRLQSSWSHDALTTLKLICNLRGVRGTGKADKDGFYKAAFWLFKNHPKTLAFNVTVFGEFGYFKDFPEIMYRIIEGLEVEVNSKRKKGASDQCCDKETARVLRKEREVMKAKKALSMYKNDKNYRFLFDSVADFFAELLKSDVGAMHSKDYKKISLAAKWCPSIDSSYDKATLICEAIARRIFPYEDYEGMEESHYSFRVRDKLRREVLVPLRKILQLPEVYMSASEWSLLPYNRVASVAMKNYKKLFLKHDKERFNEYLENVNRGKAKIAAGALLPHQIVAALNDEDGGEVAELQWKRMVEDVSKKGKLRNCIAVCDVSGSMAGTPMDVCVALGLLVSECSAEPWKGKVITFSEDPQLHLIEGSTLLEKTQFIADMDAGMNTDFQKVFDMILEEAVKNKLSEDELIKRVLVFSDMEFDDAAGKANWQQGYLNEEDEASLKETTKWETDYQVIERKFRERGYGKVPEIVFWNLRNSSSTPVVAQQSGVALVSGFSKNLLTLFLEEGGIVSPEDVMRLAIAGEEYNRLAVYD